MTWWQELVFVAGALVLWVLLMVGYAKLEIRWDKRRAQGLAKRQARIVKEQAAKAE